MVYRVADQQAGLGDRFKAWKAHRGRTASASRIAFVPWDVNEGQEWHAKVQNWQSVNTAEKGKTIDLIYYDPTRPDARLVALSGSRDGVVYMRGHGSPSSPTIGTRVTGPTGSIVENPLKIEDACDRLIDMGLPTDFRGAVKFFFCYSGTVWKDVAAERAAAERENRDRLRVVGPGAQLKTVPSTKSLARAGADHMRSRGYRFCVYYGYLGPLSSMYTDDPTDFDDPNEVQTGVRSHKQVKLDGDLVDRSRALRGRHLVRASTGRIVV